MAKKSNRRHAALNCNRASHFSIATANTTSWSNAAEFLLASDSEVLLLQETKSQPADVRAFRRRAYNAGYLFKEAHAIGDRKISLSSGVLVAWKRHLRIDQQDNIEKSERYVDISLTNALLGEIVIASVYLHQGVALQQGGLNDLLLFKFFPSSKSRAPDAL